MLHPTAKSRLICVRRLYLHTLIEFFFKVLGTLFPASINDMTVPLRDHFSLSVTGVALYGLDVSAGQHQFVTDAAMPQAVKGYHLKPQLQQLLLQ